MKKSLICLLAVCVLVLSSCGSANSAQIYYNYDITEYISVGDFDYTVDRESYDYKNFRHGYFLDHFEDVCAYTATEGTVEEWDVVKFNYSGTYEGKEFDGSYDMNSEVTVGSGDFTVAAIEEALLGAEIGVNFEVDILMPEDYSDTTVAGKVTQFMLCVTSATKYREVSERYAKEAGFESVADYEQSADNYALSLCAFYKIYDATTFNSFPELETQVLLSSVLSKKEKECKEQGITLDELAASYGWSLDTYKANLTQAIQYSYQNMPRDLVSFYVLQINNNYLTAEDVEKTRADIVAEVGEDIEAAGYTEIEVQRRSAYEKALDILLEKVQVR